MSSIDAAALVLHQVFAAVWVGSVVFVAVAVLPLARAGDVGTEPLDAVVQRLQLVSRVSATVLLLTGAYVLYAVTLDGSLAVGGLLESGRGHLVLTMVALWLGLMATVEIGSARLRDGLDVGKLRDPARTARPWYLAATLLAIAVSVVAGLLSAGVGA